MTTVIRKRGDVTTRIIARDDEKARVLNSARKVNPFRDASPLKKGERFDIDALTTRVLREGINCAKLFDSVEQYLPLTSRALQLQDTLSKVYPALNQTRSFRARFASHFSQGDTVQRATRRVLCNLSDCIVKDEEA